MNKKWLQTDLQQIKKMMGEAKTFQEMADYFGVSKEAIKLIIQRKKIERWIYCLDCRKPIDNPKCARKRCPDCSYKRTQIIKIEKSKEWYQKNKKEIYKKRDKVRFGGNREKVIKRDKEKCVICGMNRLEHQEKYNKDLLVCSKDISERIYNSPKTDIENLETLCIVCQGRKRVSKRVQDWSMCGGFSEKQQKYFEHKREENKRIVRCSKCKKVFNIYYEPLKYKDRWRNQKCEHCGTKFNYTKKEVFNWN